jgi:lantibiotic modifying enzyme
MSFNFPQMHNKIEIKLEQIANCIAGKIQKNHEDNLMGIYNGDFGILMFLLYYSEYSNSKKYVLLTENYAEKLLKKIDLHVMIHTFCSGLSGILYLFDFLKRQDLIDIDIEDSKLLLEDFLVKEMQKDINNRYYDFMHGALGVGFYFLKRNENKNPIIQLIDFLYKTAEKKPHSNIFKWKSSLNTDNDIGYNIALSHGMASIVIFLAHCIKKNIIENKVNEMLVGTINYILSQEIDYKKYGSFFPPQSLENNNRLILSSRLGWCYGDLGVAFSIWYAGKVTCNKKWEKKGLNILLISTERIPTVEKSVFDAGICHGSTGVAMIYRRMYLETGNIIFLDAFHNWLKQTIVYSNFSDGLAGYKTKEGKQWTNDYTLLTGIAGIGLMFLSYTMNDQQCWDELFLLS